MKIIVAQLGARRHYAVPRILHQAGMLQRLYTDSYVGNKPWLERSLSAIPKSVRPAGAQRLLGRKDEHIPPEKVTSFDAFGLGLVRAQNSTVDPRVLVEHFAASGRQFCERVITARPQVADAVWAFHGAALELFRWAKSRGMRCILEQCSAPRRVMGRLIAEELERWPGWEPGLQPPADPDPLSEREEAEWELADRIIVGSQFVVDGIRACGGPADKCIMIPSGVDGSNFRPREHWDRRATDGLRVMFAGRVSLMNGAPYLLEALRQLGPGRVEARFAGTVCLARGKLEGYQEVSSFLGHLSRAQMPGLYQWADVLVLPSISEGSAIVTYEALACGVTVVCTPNAGSIVRDGIDGFVVPARDAEAIAEKLRLIGNGQLQAAGAPPDAIMLASYGERLLAAARSCQ